MNSLRDESGFIPVSQPSISEKDIAYVNDAVRSGWVSSIGRYVEEFERRYAEFCGTRYALTTSNGTVALHLALVCAGVQRSDEVIVPDLTFIATANAVGYTGARPVLVDIDENTLCISPEAVRKAVTKRTRAIIPVHLYGHPADMDPILDIAQEHGLAVIEDAAEAHGAEYRGVKVGGLGDCGIFSFYGNKVITSGEGGMITMNDENLYERAKNLRDHAMSPERRYWHTEMGYNYRMTNLQAALGVAQLERIDAFLEKRREIMGWYRAELSGHPRLRLKADSSWAKNVYWMVCVEVPGMTDTGRRQLMERLRQRGVDSRPYFYPISDMPMYEKADTPVTHKISPWGLNLPSFFDISHDQVTYVCRQLIALLGEAEIA